ncbi:ribose 5-phosphate isomerase [Cystobasidium minutum MCA 4210]|uniref:ribose 5-phosphate isomerase n=1 Tax=Cystobasidium minutum MCA 4210 TaxID=1397322 RepID=UPI0034CF73E0|eukprot:jgi/Rhomi1/139161/e_gw1.1.1169.1
MLSSSHAESALDDGDSDEDEEDADETADIDGTLRTGNTRFRSGSRRLSRLSSTLGEGITAHWKRSTPSASAGSKSPAEPPSQPATARPEKSAGEQPEAPAQASEPIPGSSLPPSAGLPDVHLEQKKEKAAATLSPIEQAKRLAAYRAVDVHVKPHHRVIGIGSGSTVPYVVDRLLEQGEEANKKRWFVPTGFQSKELIVNAGLKLGDVDQFPVIDVTIDGADDVDWALNAIKGGGACHLREKVLAEAAEEFIIVADYRKNNMILGQSWKQGIPIETPPFAYSKVFDNLERIPGCMVAQLRMGQAKAGPVVTDNGNFVIDAPFDEAHMREPESLLVKIKMLTGVVEVGLFCGMAKAAYFGKADGSVTVRWSDGQQETLKDGQQARITADMIDENYRPTDLLLTYQLPQQTQEGSKTSGLEANKLQQKLEQLRMTST